MRLRAVGIVIGSRGWYSWSGLDWIGLARTCNDGRDKTYIFFPSSMCRALRTDDGLVSLWALAPLFFLSKRVSYPLVARLVGVFSP